MPYVLGIDIGSTTTAAAVVRSQGSSWGPPEIVRLTRSDAPVPSVLLMAANRSIAVGDPADYGDQVDSGRIARGFSLRIGDDVPLLLGGEPCTAQALTAMLAMWVVERVVEQEGEQPDLVALSHPAPWGAYRRQLLSEALWEIGLTDVALLPAPVAVAAEHAARNRAGRTLAVYTLGGNTFEPAVVNRAQPLGYELRGFLPDAEPLGGADFDEALVEHVRTGLGRELGDVTDPLVRQALIELRLECARVKVELSTADTAQVRLRLPDRQLRVPVTRAEFEELIRPAVLLTVEDLLRTVRSCGLTPAELDGVLLAGGSARIPLVQELVAEQLPVPIDTAPDPRLAVAAGAGLAGCQILDRRRGNRPPPRPPVMRPPRAGFRREELQRRGRGRTGPAVRPDREPARDAEEHARMPPRPPVRITPLELPMRVASRLAPGRETMLLGLAVLVVVLGVVLTVAFGPDALTNAGATGGDR